MPRDLLLSGDPRAALAALRTCLDEFEKEYNDLFADESWCDEPRQQLVAALAELEAGRESRALSRLPEPDDVQGEPEVYRLRPTTPAQARCAA